LIRRSCSHSPVVPALRGQEARIDGPLMDDVARDKQRGFSFLRDKSGLCSLRSPFENPFSFALTIV
jgi:hypothetical protein